MLHNAARGDDKWSHWRGDVFDPLFAHRISNPLPSREEAKLYLSGMYFFRIYYIFHALTPSHPFYSSISIAPCASRQICLKYSTNMVLIHCGIVFTNVDFFQNFNTMFPLFHQQTIETLFEKYYGGTLPFESGWYASFNMMLAIGCRVRGAQSPNIEEEAKGWSYFQNSASVLTELTLKNTNLLSIQAMLAMVSLHFI